MAFIFAGGNLDAEPRTPGIANGELDEPVSIPTFHHLVGGSGNLSNTNRSLSVV